MKIEMEADFGAALAMLTDLERTQIPFAAMKALNQTAGDIQDIERANVSRDFTIRRPWVLQGIARISHFATKQELFVVLDVEQRRDFMNKFESDTVKLPKHGAHIAVPVSSFKAKSGIVPDSLRPKNLGLTAQGNRTIGNQRSFLLRMSNGNLGIFRRTGPGSIQLMYSLKPSVPITPNLRFVATAAMVVRDGFEANFENAMQRAVATARPYP